MALAQLDGDMSPQSPNPFYVPLGAASPLWLMFAGAASAGVAFWWMTRWTAATHLEAAFGAVDQPLAARAPEPEAIVFEEPSPLVEAVEEMVAPPSPMVEAASEAAVDTPKPKIKVRPATDAPPIA